MTGRAVPIGAATRYAPLPPVFALHAGGVLPNGRIAFETFGVADTTGERTILLFTGLSASAHASASPLDPTPGWWQQIVGPGRAIDTDRWFVICVTSLGSCFGSSGPTEADSDGRRWGPRFPTVSIEDIASAGWHVLQHLGLARVHSVIGASLGGMTVLAFATRHPGTARHLVSISGTLAPTTIAIGLRAVQREAIERDPAFQNGNYLPEQPPRAGLRLARMLGTLTYRAPAGLQRRFGRTRNDDGFEIEHYLALQGERFADSFDANAYLQLSRAMDRFDLAAAGDPARAFAAAKLESALVIGVEQDLLFPITDQARIVDALERASVPTQFVRVASDEGHDAFLIDLAPFDAALRKHLKPEVIAHAC